MTEKEHDIVHDTPIEDLPFLLGSMTDDQKAAAKGRMRAAKTLNLAKQAKLWRGKQRASAMSHPAVVQIAVDRSGEAVCGMIALLPNNIPGSRPIQEGERILVDITEPRIATHIRARNLEVVMEAPTRPLIFETKEMAVATDPRRSHQTPPSLTNAYLAEIARETQEIFAELEQVQRATAAAEDADLEIDDETKAVLREQQLNSIASEAAESVEEPAPTVEEDSDHIVRRRVLKRARAEEAQKRVSGDG